MIQFPPRVGPVAAAALLAVALGPAAAQSARPSAPPSAPAASSRPQQVEVTGAAAPGARGARTGAYRVTHVGDTFLTVRCLEGGTVFVSRRSIDEAPGATPSVRRDGALRRSCRAVDYTR